MNRPQRQLSLCSHRARPILLLLWILTIGCSRCREAPAPSDSGKTIEQPKTEEKRPPDLRRDIFERSARVDTYSGKEPQLGGLVAVGTGVHFDDDLILTAAHVVEKGKSWGYEIVEIREERIHAFMEGGKLVGVDAARDVALLRTEERYGNRVKRNRIPIATAPLERCEVVYVYSPAPGMAGRIWTGRAIDATTISLAVRPGTSGAGVFVLRNDRYELAGLVIARTDVPPHELSRTTTEQGGNRVNIIVQEAGVTVTHVVPALAIEELLKRCGAAK